MSRYEVYTGSLNGIGQLIGGYDTLDAAKKAADDAKGSGTALVTVWEFPAGGKSKIVYHI